MFYSQFILAKKGPLGTIWIAAHLERKLRKNQVADTDIGVSVDSIICPEVPIALRLSSHLLLGVVRIYSKKVNYLFNDCSEALLKIKQAFRSSAVDLPPEESTAPYHSITLPETFHLDDFELPDNAGDFVDHHVSAKEQITLQDSMGGAGFLTMQFGLDERFGDGNASHIGLDLDEVFLDKQASPQVNFFTFPQDERVVHQGQGSSSFPGNAMDIDDNQIGFFNETKVEAPEQFSELGNNDGNEPDLTNVVDLNRNGLTSNSHGFDIQTPDLNLLCFQDDDSEVSPGATEQVDVETTVGEFRLPNLAECSHAPSTPRVFEETFSASMPESPALSLQLKHSSSSMEVGIRTENSSLQPECPDSATNNTMRVVTEPHLFESGSVEFSPTLIICEREDSITILGEKLNEQDDVDALQAEYANNELKDQQIDVGASKDGKSVLTAVAQLEINKVPAEVGTLEENIPEVSIAGPGVNCQSTAEENGLHVEVSDGLLDKCSNTLKVINNYLLHDESRLTRTELAQDVINIKRLSGSILQNENQPDKLNCSASCELAEPEKMLLAPSAGVNLAIESSHVTTEKTVTESDGSVNKITSLSGKKRYLTESALLLQGDNISAKSSSRQRIRSTGYVPNDDDLLASILTGKGTPLLRIAPTPIIVPSSKRPRATKRKVVLDDASVLHADLIRQQLIKTEDIRRIRKKAPCTRPDIWLILRGSLGDEIFYEPILTGMSMELHCLHAGIYGSETGRHSSCLDSLKKFDVFKEVNNKEKAELSLIIPEKTDECVAQEHLESVTVLPQLEQSSHDLQATLLTTDTIEEKVAEDFVEPQDQATPSDLIATEAQQSLAGQVQNGDAQVEQSNNDLRSTLLTTETIVEKIAEGFVVPQEQITRNDLIADEAQQSVSGQVQIGDLQVEKNDAAFNFGEGEPQSTLIDMEYEGTVLASEGLDEREGMFDAKVGAESSTQIDFHDEENHLPSDIFFERPEMAASSLTHPSSENGKFPSTIGENTDFQEFDLERSVNVESMPFDLTGAKECSDFCSAIDGNDTEFLNVDDEVDYDEEADNDASDPQDARSLENSGWSSRTRGVARYLQTIFDEESGLGRKDVSVDRLIAGKTRKEASRMFFETLVLKTKDYIHVEQDSPFDSITIKPKTRLLKSEF